MKSDKLNYFAVCTLCRYELMRQCWVEEASDRPTFTELATKLDNLLYGQEPEGNDDNKTKSKAFKRKTTVKIPSDYLTRDSAGQKNYDVFRSPHDAMEMMSPTAVPNEYLKKTEQRSDANGYLLPTPHPGGSSASKSTKAVLKKR